MVLIQLSEAHESAIDPKAAFALECLAAAHADLQTLRLVIAQRPNDARRELLLNNDVVESYLGNAQMAIEALPDDWSVTIRSSDAMRLMAQANHLSLESTAKGIQTTIPRHLISDIGVVRDHLNEQHYLEFFAKPTANARLGSLVSLSGIRPDQLEFEFAPPQPETN